MRPTARKTKKRFSAERGVLIPFVAERIEQENPSGLIVSNRALRRHPQAKIAALRANIIEFGFIIPIVVDADNRVLAGDASLSVANSLNLTSVPVIRVEHLTKAQARAFEIADNRLVEMSTWDEPALKDAFAEILEVDSEFELELTGFHTAEIDRIFEIDLDANDADNDDAYVEPPQKAVSELGDVWQLGDHRILCGDATNAETVARFIDGGHIDLTVTDPPYNVAVQGHVRTGAKYKHREFVQTSGEMNETEYERFPRSTLSSVF